jgi:hypothetical protein
MSVSLVDQLVERILSAEQNNLEIAQFENLPVKPGMGFSLDKVRAVGANLNDMETLVSSDVSGWDWSVSGAELMFDAYRRIKLAGVSEDHPYARCVVNRAVCLSRSVVAFSNGDLVAQRYDGLQKSGSYNTSSGNSWIRVAAAVYCGATQVVAMGDDCVDNGHCSSKMAAIGHPIKEASVVTRFDPGWSEMSRMWPGELGGIVRSILEACSWKPFDVRLHPVAEFCSHYWCKLGSEWVTVYSGWRKSLFRLANQNDNHIELFGQFSALMANNPAMPYCVCELLSRNWFPVSWLRLVS